VKLSACLALFALAGVATAKVFLVPEHYPTVQSGLLNVAHGDTLSIRYSTPNHSRTSFGCIEFNGTKIMVLPRNCEDQNMFGKPRYVEEAGFLPLYLRTTECGDCNDDERITIADATYLVAYVYRGGAAPVGQGDVNLDGAITIADAVSLVNFIYRAGRPPCAEGWIGQRQVNEPDSIFDTGPEMAMDLEGDPWIVWVGKQQTTDREEEIFYTKWEGSSWKAEGLVNIPDSLGDFRPTIAVDDSGTIFVVWHHRFLTDKLETTDIWFTTWNGSGWEEPSAVYTSLDRDDYAPIVSAGGGEVWVVWYEGALVTPVYYNVFASRWTGSTWGQPMQVSPPNNDDNWWAYVAVDDNGSPHVVYSAYRYGAVYYTMYTGSSWTTRVLLNDTTLVQGYNPAIEIDSNGGIHVVWVGIRLHPAVDYDIYYSFSSDGTNFSEPVMINVDDSSNDDGGKIAVNSPSDIWVAWDKEYSLWDTHVFVSHLDGTSWSPEHRLNNDSTMTNLGPTVKTDALGRPWVGWSGTENIQPEVYYNRYVSQPGTSPTGR